MDSTTGQIKLIQGRKGGEGIVRNDGERTSIGQVDYSLVSWQVRKMISQCLVTASRNPSESSTHWNSYITLSDKITPKRDLRNWIVDNSWLKEGTCVWLSSKKADITSWEQHSKLNEFWIKYVCFVTSNKSTTNRQILTKHQQQHGDSWTLRAATKSRDLFFFTDPVKKRKRTIWIYCYVFIWPSSGHPDLCFFFPKIWKGK